MFRQIIHIIIFILVVLLSKTSFGQFIRKGIVYGKTGGQRIERTFVDNEGSIYHSFLTASTDTIVIDSLGVPINILPSPFSISGFRLIKFNHLGVYQFTLYLENGTGWGVDMKFTSTNDAIINYEIPREVSTTRIFDGQGRVLKNLQLFNGVAGPSELSITSSVICKVNKQGDVLWANGISMLKLPKRLGGTFGKGSTAGIPEIIINQKNEIKILYSVIKTDTSAIFDTLVFTNNQNQQSYHPVMGPYLMLTFTQSGNMLSINKPFQNTFKQVQQDSTVYYRVNGLTTDGVHCYGIVRFSITRHDTFYQTVLVPGGYNFLVKFNGDDSILWAKPISRELERWYYQVTKFSYDTNLQQLVLAIPYDPYYFEFMLNPTFNLSFSGSYICRLNTEGEVISGLFLNANDDRRAVTNIAYNAINKTYVIIGYTNGNEPKLQQHLPDNPNYFPMPFVAQMDSLNQIITAESISGSNKILDSEIFLTNRDIFISKPSSSIIDNFGRVHISGWFRYDILLPCDTLKANGDFSITGVNVPSPDGFLLFYYPLFYQDTNVCNNMISPSGKYIWNVTGLFSDTIKSKNGCDSILFYRLFIKRSNSELDTVVCNPIKSISGKYFLDSSGIYFDTIQNVYGCDSIIKIKIQIRSTKSTLDTTVKDTLLSPSLKYKWVISGAYKDTLINKNGCDSVIDIRLKVLNCRIEIDTFNCNPIQYLSNLKWIDSTGIYKDTLSTVYGGDSIITIRFTLGRSKNIIDTISCGNLVSPSKKYIWEKSGIYIDTVFNSLRCDSIITVNFRKLENTDSISYTICDSLVSPSGRYIYKVTGIYHDTIPSVGGCDSVLIISINNYRRELVINKTNDIDCTNLISELSVEDGSFSQLVWSPNISIDNLNAARVKVNPKQKITYYLFATDTLGCNYIDSIDVLVNGSDTIGLFPNVFTPNLDGSNDCLDFNRFAKLVSVNFLVFNRWGDKVFETTDSNLCWQGNTVKGDDLAEGVYYYLLNGKTECNKTIQLQGTLTILR